MKANNMIPRVFPIWVLTITLSFSSVQTTALADFLRLNPPPDADKPLPVPAGNYSCWLATAANMLAGAGYGHGNTVQARADDIYTDLIAQYTTAIPGWPDVAIDWWLNHSSHNHWPGNPYDTCDVYRGGPWLGLNIPQEIGNRLRIWNYVGLGIEVLVSGSCDPFDGIHDPNGVVPNGPGDPICSYLMSHAITAWGDERGEEDLTDNPAQVWVTDSDRDTGGDVQKYDYLFDAQQEWRLNYTPVNPPLRYVAVLKPNDIVTDAKDTVLVVGSYKIHQGHSEQEASDLHYKVGTDTAICSYRTTIDWPRPNNPGPPVIVEDASPPWCLGVEWDLSKDPVPYCNSVTITTEFVLSLRNDIEYEDVHWTFPGGETRSMPGFGWVISTPQYIDPNAVIADLTGGYVVGSFDIVEIITDEGGVQVPHQVAQYRFQHEYLYFQDPEHHEFELMPLQVPLQGRAYYVANLRLGHSYGLLDDESLWAFDDWMNEYPANREFVPGVSIGIPLDWAGRLPYPKCMRPVQVKAHDPSPADGAIHENIWVTLTWSPGEYAVSHNVYLDDNYDSVNDGTEDAFRGNQATAFFVAGFPGFAYPDGLVPGMTYYWRIDEVNDLCPDSPWKGDVWRFTVPPRTASHPDPADRATFVEPNVVLSWAPGFGAQSHTVYFGDNLEDVNNATGGASQEATTYTPGPLELVTTYYWRVDEFDGVTTYKGNVWCFATKPPTNRILDIVKKLPADAVQSHLEIQLKEVLLELGRTTRKDIPLIRQATVLLRNQPNAVRAFVSIYGNTPREAFQTRLRILKLVGELQRPDALDFLREVAWSPLPAVTPEPIEGTTAREYEEILQSKAVQGIAYLREDNGDLKQEAVEETVKIMQIHPARAVRIAAIDAYMWNHGDTRDHATELYKVLPQEFHEYVERPRFYNGMNREVFDARLQTWREKWAR